MPLYLIELKPAEATRESVGDLIEKVVSAVGSGDGELIETQVTSDHRIVFVVVEADSPRFASPVVKAVEGSAEIAGPDEVRLVGAELDDIKKLKSHADYLIPAEITMDQYLARKKANSPKYAEVPEVSFLRTYVREDTAKCLCFYDAPDEDAVTRARAAVQTPIDRLFKLDV